MSHWDGYNLQVFIRKMRNHGHWLEGFASALGSVSMMDKVKDLRSDLNQFERFLASQNDEGRRDQPTVRQADVPAESR